MTQKMMVYLGVGWLFLTVGPLAIIISARLNKAVRMIHHEKKVLFQLFPVSSQLRSAMKSDKVYRTLLWANASSVVVFFLLMFVAKLIG